MAFNIIKILIIVIILGVIWYLLRLSHTLKLEKRIGEYAISSNLDKENYSLLDKIINIKNKLIKKISQVIKHSVFLSKYSLKYNKYIEYKDKDKYNEIDYVSLKILISILSIILSIVISSFYKIKLDFPVLLLIFLIGFYSLDIYLTINYNKKRKIVENDLLKAIIIMNSAFKSGRNIMQAVEVVKDELDGPIQDEFKKIYLDITYGLELDLVFKRFYERVKLEDAKYISSSLTLLNKTGGDIVKVFSLIEKSIFEKKNLKNELNSLTASSQFVFKLLIFLPLLLVSLIFMLNPSYFEVMIKEPLGIILLIFIILLYILYILVVQKVLEVDL